MRLVAIDRAGNSVESSGAFTAVGISVPELDPIPLKVSADEQLLVIGRTQTPDSSVTVNIKRGDDQAVILKTKSDFNRSFFVLTPKLKPGSYDIWAETSFANETVTSAHLHTKVTSHLLITIGSYTVTALYLIIPILAFLLLLFVLIYRWGHHYSRFMHKLKMRTALVKGDNSKILHLLKKRLQKHLEILQNTRHGRILTKEEKEIKEAIEGDLDEVDKAIGEQNKG